MKISENCKEIPASFVLSVLIIFTILLPNFVRSGVSTEMVIELCKTLGRSCYAYNGNNKCFAKYVYHNKNYCPIAFYKYNGHLFNEYKEFIINYGKQPCDLEKEGKIVQISFPVFNLPSEMKPPFPQVFIMCDANYGKGLNIDRDLLVQECHQNEINYKNQGLGTIVNTLINRLNKKSERRSLSEEEKKIVRDKSFGFCVNCHLESTNFEYDHILNHYHQEEQMILIISNCYVTIAI